LRGENQLACGSVEHPPNVYGLYLQGFVGIAGSGNMQCVADVLPDSSQHDDTPAEETPDAVAEETPDSVADIAEETSPEVENVPVDQKPPLLPLKKRPLRLKWKSPRRPTMKKMNVL